MDAEALHGCSHAVFACPSAAEGRMFLNADRTALALDDYVFHVGNACDDVLLTRAAVDHGCRAC